MVWITTGEIETHSQHLRLLPNSAGLPSKEKQPEEDVDKKWLKLDTKKILRTKQRIKWN